MQTSKVVYLPNGSTSKIISYLSLRNFDISKFDIIFLKFFGMPQSGWIDVQYEKTSKFDFLYQITNAKAAMTDITLIPGETSEYFLLQTSKQLGLNYDILLKELKLLSPIPEGFLVPDTYKIPIGIEEKHLIFYLVNTSKAKHEEMSKKIFGVWDEKQWYKYLKVASIVQKEAASEDEMPLVASVIYNRLKKGYRLQMDGTLNYGLYSHDKITRERIDSDKTSYNTYKRYGLPEFAVCNVSFAAIKAAIFPKKSDYLYFVRNKDTGKHAFTSTLIDHNKEIKKSNQAQSKAKQNKSNQSKSTKNKTNQNKKK